MRIPLSWLREFIDLELPAQEIGKLLTQLGIEVEKTALSRPAFSDVVVAKVISVERHPDATSLSVAQVNDGLETFQIVCGAPNCRAGIKTAFARIGAKLPSGDVIREVSLRGITSYGMLCSFDELGINCHNDGIIEFDAHLSEGADIADLYADTIFEICLTPDLGHCASVFGVARELAALLGKRTAMPPIAELSSAGHLSRHIIIDNPERCARYTCCLLEDIKVGPSPEWLQRRLVLSGLRSINNVVDVANYVLLELGQPLHAFDAHLLEGLEVRVRQAIKGEEMLGLEDSLVKLTEDDLVIADSKGVVALAGILGGKRSCVTEATKSILLESATFDALTIRRSHKRLNLCTDAARRFDRGVDPSFTVIAIERAAQLLIECAHAKVRGFSDSYPGLKAPRQIRCRLERLERILGLQISRGELELFFEKMHLSFTSQDSLYTLIVPHHRHDLNDEIDIIEEVAKFYGYDNIPYSEGRYSPTAVPDTPMYHFEMEVREALIGAGLQEMITCDLISPSQIALAVDKSLPIEAKIAVLNPASSEQSMLRPSLLPGLLQVVSHNIDRGIRDVAGFEVGRIHYREGDRYIDQPTVGMVLTGLAIPAHWDRSGADFDFYDLKGIVESLLRTLSVSDYILMSSGLSTLHEGRQGVITLDGCELGALGEVHPALLRSFHIHQRVLFAEFNLEVLLSKRKLLQKVTPLALYPSSERDWTVTVDEQLSFAQLIGSINQEPSFLRESVALIGVYRDEVLTQSHKKNCTLRFVYRDSSKTVSQAEVDAEHQRTIETVLRSLLELSSSM